MMRVGIPVALRGRTMTLSSWEKSDSRPTSGLTFKLQDLEQLLSELRVSVSELERERWKDGSDVTSVFEIP